MGPWREKESAAKNVFNSKHFVGKGKRKGGPGRASKSTTGEGVKGVIGGGGREKERIIGRSPLPPPPFAIEVGERRRGEADDVPLSKKKKTGESDPGKIRLNHSSTSFSGGEGGKKGTKRVSLFSPQRQRRKGRNAEKGKDARCHYLYSANCFTRQEKKRKKKEPTEDRGPRSYRRETKGEERGGGSEGRRDSKHSCSLYPYIEEGEKGGRLDFHHLSTEGEYSREGRKLDPANFVKVTGKEGKNRGCPVPRPLCHWYKKEKEVFRRGGKGRTDERDYRDPMPIPRYPGGMRGGRRKPNLRACGALLTILY